MSDLAPAYENLEGAITLSITSTGGGDTWKVDVSAVGLQVQMGGVSVAVSVRAFMDRTFSTFWFEPALSVAASDL